MYKATQEGGGAQPNAGNGQENAGGSAAGENVTDAEFEEVK
jgi:hypothetical protein